MISMRYSAGVILQEDTSRTDLGNRTQVFAFHDYRGVLNDGGTT